MATYYMRADGTAANKAAATGPASDAAACMSIATHNLETFSPGDIIRLSDQGGTYTAVLDTPSSGTAGNRITYIAVAGETPIIDAETTRSYCVKNDNQTYLHFENLQLINGADPGQCIDITTDITCTGLVVSGAGDQSFQIGGGNPVLTNCTISGSGDDGISIHGTATVTVNGGTISGCGQGIGNNSQACTVICNGVSIVDNTINGIAVNVGTCTLNNCFFRQQLNVASELLSLQGTIRNCVFDLRYGSASAFAAIRAIGVVNVYNCTLIGGGKGDIQAIGSPGENVSRLCVAIDMQAAASEAGPVAAALLAAVPSARM